MIKGSLDIKPPSDQSSIDSFESFEDEVMPLDGKDTPSNRPRKSGQ